MNTANLKTLAFWADMLLTVASVAMASGLVSDATWTHYLGWAVATLTTLGYHAFDIGGIATSPGAPTPSAPKA